MLIKALCDYADKQVSEIPEGFEKCSIHFIIELTKEGDLIDIVDVRKENKKSIFPIRKSKTSISSEIIEHRSKYIFGLEYKKGVLVVAENKKHEPICFNEFVKTNHAFLNDINSDITKAVVEFMKKWKPQDELTNQKILDLKPGDFTKSWFTFVIAGEPGISLEKDMAVIQKYTEKYVNSEESCKEKGIESVCGILGEKLSIAETHDKINFHGGKCSLVNMKETAYHSYGKIKSYNSNISVKAMKKYTVTFNNLLKDGKHTVFIDDMVLLYFAIKNNDIEICKNFSMFFQDNYDKEIEDSISTLMKYAKKGYTTDEDSIDNIVKNKNVTFYIVGYTQNKSRICQKFIYRGSFGEMLNNLIKHQNDLSINENNPRPIYFSGIAKELKSPKSTDEKIPSPLMTSIILAALNNTKYPDSMLSTVIRRIKTDSDDDKNHYIKLNDTRAGIIKACLNRKYKKEEITMAWNEENKNPAYLCGGLFAVYEKIQQEASGGNLNRTIKDAYFASACSRPSSVFPKLAKLAQNHMRKLGDGAEIYFNKMIGNITNSLDGEFPSTLSLDDQGRFIVGYYQMNKKLYTSTKD